MKKKETGEVVVDLSGMPDDLSSVSLPAATVKAIDEAMEDGGEGLSIILPGSRVTFDPTALAAIASEMSGSELKLTVEPIAESKLSPRGNASGAQIATIVMRYCAEAEE